VDSGSDLALNLEHLARILHDAKSALEKISRQNILQQFGKRKSITDRLSKLVTQLDQAMQEFSLLSQMRIESNLIKISAGVRKLQVRERHDDDYHIIRLPDLEVLNALDEEGGLFEARHKGELRIVKKVKDKKIFEETIEFLKFVRPLVQLQFPQLVGYSIHGPDTQGSTAAWIACCHTDLVPLGAYLEAKKSDPLQHFIVTSIIAMDCQEALEFLHSNKLEWDPRQLGLQNLISESSGRMWIGFYDGDIKPAKKQDDLAFRMFRSNIRLHGAIQGVPTLSPKFYKEHVKKLKKEKSTLETLMLVKGLLFGRTLLWGFRRLRTVVPAGPSSLLTSSASSLLLLPTWYPKSIDDILFPLQKGDISQSFSLEIKMTIIQEKPMSSSTKTHDISHPFAATGTNFNQDTSAFLESCGIKPQIVHTENPQIKEYDLSLYLSPGEMPKCHVNSG